MKAAFLSGCVGLCWALTSHLAWALDINQATEADLDSLKGVGPATTQRILAERGQAPFSSWTDLMARVKGLRTPTARKLSDQGLTVNGVPLEGVNVSPAAAQTTAPKPPPPGV